MRIIKFKEETWDFTVHLLVPATMAQALAYVKKVTGETEEDPGLAHAVTFSSVEDVIIAFSEPFKPTPEQIGLLGHELFHAVSNALELRDVKLTEDTDEVYAYLMGSLLRRCLERL